MTMPPPFQLQYFDPHEALTRHILATFYFATSQAEIIDRHPGALSQLVLFSCGVGGAHFDDRFDRVGAGPWLFSGFTKAVPIEMAGEWHAIGASLSPLGWAALTQTHFDDHLDRFIPAEELLGPDIVAFSRDLIARDLAGEVTGEAACKELARWIEARLITVPVAHERLIENTIQWIGSSLNPDVEALFANIGYSRRQAERLVRQYFGFTPAALARKYRAVRSAALLAQEDLSPTDEARIAEAFYDQPHMIKEIRRFCGYTPSRLGGPGDPLFHTLLQMKNFDRLQQFRATTD